MQPASITLNPAHSVLLHDLKAAGVTDILGPAAAPWLGAAPQPILSAPQPAQPTSAAPAQPTAPVTKKAKPAPLPQPTLPLPDPATCLTLTGTPEQLLVITGALHEQGEHPFTADEHTLLTNMLAAIDIPMAHTAILACSVADPHGSPYPATFKETLAPALQAQVSQISAPAILMLGQVAAELATGQAHSLSTAREEAQAGTWDQTAPSGITYHPRHLLKQPQLKRLAWQDLLSLQHRFKRKTS